MNFSDSNPTQILSYGFINASLCPDNHDGHLVLPCDLPLDIEAKIKEAFGIGVLRKMGRYVKLVALGAKLCLDKVDKQTYLGKRLGLFLSTGLGNQPEVVRFSIDLFSSPSGLASPTLFASSVSNSAAFAISKLFDFNGVSYTLSQDDLSFESSLEHADLLLRLGEIDMALVGGVDVFCGPYEEQAERTMMNDESLTLGEGSGWVLLSREPNSNPVGHLDSVKTCGAVASGSLKSELEASLNANIFKQKTFVARGFPIIKRDSDFAQKFETLSYLNRSGVFHTASAFALCEFLKRSAGGEPATFAHFNQNCEGNAAYFIVSNSVQNVDLSHTTF